MAEEEKPSLMPMSLQRITNWHLQKMKDEGKLITMVGTGNCDPLWAVICQYAGVDMVRMVAPGENGEERANNLPGHIKSIRKYAPNINLNAPLEASRYADKVTAVEYSARLMGEGCDSVLPMGVTNETLKYMADHWIPVFGHVGCLSGWQIEWFGGYRRVGKTADDAMKIFRTAYEYQENGMIGMTIEMTSREVTDAIAKKLRVPVIQVAAGGVADGSELVIYDLLGFQPVAAMPKHAKYYRTYFDDALAAFAEFKADVNNKAYPAEQHGWSMDEKERDTFLNLLEKVK